MAKEFMYMGKTLNELQQLSLEDFAKLTNSRARRSLVRGLEKTTLSKIQEAFKQHQGARPGPNVKAIRTHSRDFVIIPQMVGLKFAVHRGNSFEPVEIQPEMLGHRLGEYVLTRKPVKHGKAGIGSTKSSSAVTAK